MKSKLIKGPGSVLEQETVKVTNQQTRQDEKKTDKNNRRDTHIYTNTK